MLEPPAEARNKVKSTVIIRQNAPLEALSQKALYPNGVVFLRLRFLIHTKIRSLATIQVVLSVLSVSDAPKPAMHRKWTVQNRTMKLFIRHGLKVTIGDILLVREGRDIALSTSLVLK